MQIFCEDDLIIESRKISTQERLERTKKFTTNKKDWRDYWAVYTFDSQGILHSKKESATIFKTGNIIPKLKTYSPRKMQCEILKKYKNQFTMQNLNSPNHIIEIYSHNRFVYISKEEIISIKDLLKPYGISCLISKSSEQIFPNLVYASPEIAYQLEINSFERKKLKPIHIIQKNLIHQENRIDNKSRLQRILQKAFPI